ncbi:hypothetical protein [Ornithinimicrobium kibberense]|uniref:hypothetical protein n=1 Tax=Ornithinimicrobium kibberense TaxID=282060 RepID=UPI003616D10C
MLSTVSRPVVEPVLGRPGHHGRPPRIVRPASSSRAGLATQSAAPVPLSARGGSLASSSLRTLELPWPRP